jgi:hypothetical protein
MRSAEAEPIGALSLSAEKAELSEQDAESRNVGFVRELVRLLVKTQKAQRLYDSKNAVAERLELDLYERMSTFVSEEGEVQLVVLESQLRCEDAVVFESPDRTDSLAFLLYRDGIRRLSFSPGLELQELRAFLRCLNRVALLTNDQDDLVTLLWEQDFHSIRYFAIEELARSESYPHLSDQLVTGESPEGSSDGAAGSPAEAVSLDLKQPVSTVPVEACRLESGEIEAMQKELLVEERAPFRQLVSELALELILLEDGEDEQGEISEEIVEIVDRLIADGDVAEVVGMHEHIEGLATMIFAGATSAQKLSSELTQALAEPERFERLMERVEVVHAPRPEALTVFLARLGSSASSLLLPWMRRFSSPPYRRAVTGALLYLPNGGLGILREGLPLGPPPVEPQERLRHRQLVREVVHALSRHSSGEALPHLTELLSSPDPETRRESFLAASRYAEEGVLSLCLERLVDSDPEVRTTALDTLVKRGRADLGLQILERSLASERFERLALPEKRRLFAAVAKLSGESALDSFQKLLNAREDHWFAKQKDREFVEAVAHGIRMVGGPRAKRILEDGSRGGPKLARAACLKELGVGRS